MPDGFRSNYWQYKADNWGATPGLTPGVSVVPGASNAEGSWTASGLGALAQDVWCLYVFVGDGNTSAAQKDHLLDIGVDPAGGSSYTAIISNIVCGQSSGQGGGLQFRFPIFIPKNATIGVRVQGSNATAGTVRVGIRAYGLPTAPELVRVGSFSETIGTITNSGGVSYTPGNAVDGSWVSLGTTSKDLWHFQIGAQCSNATITAQRTQIELAFGDATDKQIITKAWVCFNSTAESMFSPLHPQLLEGDWEVPAGSTLYVRGRSSAAPATGYNAVAIGIGG